MCHGARDERSAARDRAVVALLEALPELLPVVVALAEDYGDLPGAHVVFRELGEITALLLGRLRDEEHEEQLERIFEAVEVVARTPGAETTETVAYGFVAALDPRALDLAVPYLHEESERIVEAYLTRSLDGEGDDACDGR
ncbi:MAG: hypothetical protein M0Z33_03160 [Actinomycetota bacterium]|nr:hypothetical protein [Actinomycetota bacterium]